MESVKHIYGVEILFPSWDVGGRAVDSALGLYLSGGVNSLRWVEASVNLTNAPASWAPGIIADGGVPTIKNSFDLKRGGDVAKEDDIRITLVDTTKMFLQLKALGININGMVAKIWLFVGTSANSESVSRSVVFAGRVDISSISEVDHTFTINNAKNFKNTWLGAETSDSIAIPVSFGSFVNGFGKLIRTVNENTAMTNADLFLGGVTNEFTSDKFPINRKFNYDGEVFYEVFMAPYINLSEYVNAHPSELFMYAKVILGTGKGQIRKIKYLNATNRVVTYPGEADKRWRFAEFALENESNFLTELQFDDAGNNRSWIQFIRRHSVYSADSKPCGGAFSNISFYKDDAYSVIANYAYASSGVDADKKEISVSFTNQASNVDQVDDFMIAPVENVRNVVDGEDDAFLGGLPAMHSHTLSGFKIYELSSNYGSPTITTTFTDTDFSKVIDKNASTRFRFNFTFTHNLEYYEYDIILPIAFDIPESIISAMSDDIDLYLLVKSNLVVNGECVLHGLLNSSNSINHLKRPIAEVSAYGSAGHVDNSIDFNNIPALYADNGDDSKFYNQVNTSGVHYVKEGYLSFKLESINSKDSFLKLAKSFVFNHKLILSHNSQTDSLPWTRTVQFSLYELAIMLKRSFSIEKEFYGNFDGRIFNDTFGARKTATNTVNNPIDILEYVNRYQFSDTGNAIGNIQTGNTIDTTAFDSSELITIKSLRPQMQFFSKNDQYTDSIKKQICSEYGLISFTKPDGSECVKALSALETTGDLITLHDIIGDISTLEEPEVQDVFCEPFLQYSWDEGQGKYKNKLEIIGVSDHTAWATGLTPGMPDADGASLWALCRALYLKYKRIEQPPTDFTESKFCYTYADAIVVFRNKISWMCNPIKRRFNFSLDYVNHYTWNAGDVKKIQLPKHTNGAKLRCLIESSEHNKNENISNFSIILLDDIPTTILQSVVQGTMDVGGKVQRFFDGVSPKLQEI